MLRIALGCSSKSYHNIKNYGNSAIVYGLRRYCNSTTTTTSTTIKEIHHGVVKKQYTQINNNNNDRLISIQNNDVNNTTKSTGDVVSVNNGVGVGVGSLSEKLYETFKTLFLPSGYPESVSQDYASYQRWIFVQNTLGSVTYMLSTHALLTSVGVGLSASLPFSAAISWVLKDGLGASALVLFASKYSTSLDFDLKRFKFRGDFLHNFGVFLETCTPFLPGYFLLMASISNLAKGIAGLIYGSTRASLHKSFALKENIGDITAKYQSQAMSSYLTDQVNRNEDFMLPTKMVDKLDIAFGVTVEDAFDIKDESDIVSYIKNNSISTSSNSSDDKYKYLLKVKNTNGGGRKYQVVLIENQNDKEHLNDNLNLILLKSYFHSLLIDQQSLNVIDNNQIDQQFNRFYESLQKQNQWNTNYLLYETNDIKLII
ncbi:DUF647 family protein [Heterostelium album PN500]|uniref:DUF647 family protein n=1 Tax=Heterostelium pallidum (strain ATCC 26659 / Pp 5 / PN500) TaxID=670386 RepID=D3AZ67_HETP5|nr:DUF647 family protein [Heterostelium album PN500]EFA85450.1 DUF647 family protein [Heterostelium album PN500]|eukprot:XP_020437559.1 DUF647 family protein [Heterostelium album PN500]